MPTRRDDTAYHEAGHAVITFRLGIEVLEVSAVPGGHGIAGYSQHGHLFTQPGSDRGNLDRAIQVNLAGPIAQKRFNPRSFRRWHARGDYDCALGLCRYIAGSSGQRDYFLYQMRVTRRLVDR
jgi:hypothetical protein